MLEDFAQRLQMQGLSVEQYFQYTGVTAEKIIEDMKPEAVKRIQSRLVLEAVVKAEGLTASEEEFQDELNKMAEQYKMDVEKIKTIVAESALSGDLRISNALEFIKKNAKVKKASKKKAEETEETAE